MCRILKTITQYLTINKQLTMKTTSLDIPLKWPTNTIHMYPPPPHTHTQTDTDTQRHTDTRTHACTHTDTHTHAHTHTHRHRHTHTHRHRVYYDHLTKTRATLTQVVPVYNKTGNT